MSPPHRDRAAAVLAACLLASGGAAGAAGEDWQYRVRRGDTLDSIARAYLAPERGWRDLQQVNSIADPRRLQPGTQLAIPVAWAKPRALAARVVSLRGQVTLTAPGGMSVAQPAPGLVLQEGDVLHTGADSSVLIEFTDGSTVFALADSQLKVEQVRGRAKSGAARLKLDDGRIESRVPRREPAGRFDVRTPAAQIGVRGTAFRVASASGGRHVASEVTEGKVRLSGRRGSLLVPAGFGAVVEDGRVAAKPVPLLDPPALPDPLPAINHLPARVAWPPSPGAAAYRAQLAAGEPPAPIVESLASTPDLSLRELADGDYWLKVRAIDRAGLEGQDAERVLTVAAQPEPPLIVAPPPEATLRDERPELKWTASPDVESYRVQLAADPAFERIVAATDETRSASFQPEEGLAPGEYWWRVSSRLASGKIGPFSDPQGFTYRPPPPGAAPEPAEVSRGAIQLRWRAGQPGQTWRLQFARDPEFLQVLTDRTVDEPRATLEPPGAGKYFIRVQTIDADGYAGPFGPTQLVEVPRNWWPLLFLLVPLFKL